MNNVNEITPVLGMGATVSRYGDRDACTVVDIDKKGVVTLRVDDATLISGCGSNGSGAFKYEPNPKGREYNFRRVSKSGNWERVARNPDTGRWNRMTGCVEFGARSYYRDPHF